MSVLWFSNSGLDIFGLRVTCSSTACPLSFYSQPQRCLISCLQRSRLIHLMFVVTCTSQPYHWFDSRSARWVRQPTNLSYRPLVILQQFHGKDRLQIRNSEPRLFLEPGLDMWTPSPTSPLPRMLQKVLEHLEHSFCQRSLNDYKVTP